MRKFIVTGVIVAAMLIGTATAIFAQSGNNGNKTGDKPTAWLGIVVGDQDGKVTVEDVRSGSPADTANVQIGDVIEKFNSTAVATASDLVKQVQAAAPGDKVTLAVVRNGKSLNIEVTLGSMPNFGFGRGHGFGFGFGDMPGMGQPGQPGQPGTAPMPIMVAQLLLRARLEEADNGFKVTEVSDQNPLGLKVDDVVTTINGHKVTELDFKTLMEEFANAHKNAPNNKQDKAQGDKSSSDSATPDAAPDATATTTAPTLTVEVIRDGKTVTLTGELFGGRGFGHGFGFGFGRGHHGWGGFGGFGHGSDNNPDNSAPTEEAPVATQPA